MIRVPSDTVTECVQCGDPLPVDALAEGVEFCSTECKDQYNDLEEE